MKYWIVYKSDFDNLENLAIDIGYKIVNTDTFMPFTRGRLLRNEFVYWVLEEKGFRAWEWNHPKAPLLLTERQYFKHQLPKGNKTMSVKALKAKLNETYLSHVKPYERYLVIAALLIALDHFLLKGAMRTKITGLAKALADKFISILNSGIEKLEGSKPNGQQ